MAPKKNKKGTQKKVSKELEQNFIEMEENLPLGAEATDDARSEISGTSKNGKKEVTSYNFTAVEEERLVEFYELNDCFYNKNSDHYLNTSHKRRILDDLASDLSCEGEYLILF